MDLFKVSLNRKTNDFIDLEVNESITLADDVLSFTISEGYEYNIKSGDTLTFTKIVNDASGTISDVSFTAEIQSVSGKTFTIQMPTTPYNAVDSSVESNIIVPNADDEEKYYYYGLSLVSPHGFYPQDLGFIKSVLNQALQVTLTRPGTSGTTDSYTGTVALMTESDEQPVEIGNDLYIKMVGGNTSDISSISKNKLYFKTTEDLTEEWETIIKSALVTFSQHNIVGIGLFTHLVPIGKGKRKVIKTEECRLYHFEGQTFTTVSKDAAYRNISIGLSSQDEYKSLTSEMILNDMLYNDIVANSIPDFIDMEKIKFEPHIIDDTSDVMVNEIEFNLHFRTRHLTGGIKTADENTYYTDSSVTFADGWYVISGDSSDWHIVKNSSKSGSYEFNYKKDDTTFYNSDDIGYLGFTDDDIYYQKLKVKQTFIRLAYYTTPNPLTQKLLCYSTIFLDSGELFGRICKLMNDTSNVAPYVRISGSTNSLKTRFTVKSEYNTDKSSDGFYCYLFDEDIPENDTKTIYMKVEFNHAGNGRTLPMIQWKPKLVEDESTGDMKPSETDFRAMTIDNYLDFLYIPIKIGYINNKYVYYVDVENNPWVKLDKENGKITYSLFEPYFNPSEEN